MPASNAPRTRPLFLPLIAIREHWPALVATSAAAAFALMVCKKIVKTVLSLDDYTATISPGLAYNYAVLVPNYFMNGFIRRGLAGTIMSLIDGRQIMGSAITFHIFSAAWLGVAIALVLHKVTRQNLRFGAWLAVVLLLAPQFRLWSSDLARTDLLSTGFVAFALYAAMQRRFQVASIILAFGSLAHETVVIMGLPLLVATWYVDYRDYRAKIADIAAPLATLGFFLISFALLQQEFGSAPADVGASIRATAPPSALRDIAIYVTVGGLRALVASACGSQSNPGYILFLASGFLVIPLYALVLGFRHYKMHVLLFGLVAILPYFFMVFVAFDFGRWVAMATFNAWLAGAMLAARSGSGTGSPKVRLAFAVPVLGSLILMGSGNVFFANHATGVLARKIWAQPLIPVEESFSACDPRWRDVAAGALARRGDPAGVPELATASLVRPVAGRDIRSRAQIDF